MLTVLRENLLYGLNAASKFTNSKSTLPSLAMVLLSTDNGKLSLTATNLESTIRLHIGAVVNEDFSICVNPSQLSRLLSPRKEDKVELSILEDSIQLQVKCGRLKSKLKGLDKEEFPLTPDQLQDNLIELNTSDLASAIETVLPFAFPTPARQVLNSVHFRFSENNLSLFAIDGVGMAKQEIELINSDSFKYTVSLAGVQSTLSLLRQLRPDTITLGFDNDKRMMVSGEDFYVVNQLVEGSYPDLEAFENGWLHDYESKFIIDSALLNMVLKSSAVYTKDMNQLLIESGENEVSFYISGSNGEFNDNQTSETIEGSFKALLNVQHLASIARFASDMLTVQSKDKLAPVYIYETGNSNNFWVTSRFTK